MKSDRTNSFQQRKIKRENLQRSPPLNKNGHTGLGIDNTIQIRRHSVIVSSGRHGTVQRMHQEMKLQDEQS